MTKLRLAALGLVLVTLPGCDAWVRSSLSLHRALEAFLGALIALLTLASWPIAAGFIGLYLFGDNRNSVFHKFSVGLLITLPVPTFLLWSKLGVPPSSGWLFGGLHFVLGLICIGGCVSIYVVRYERPKALPGFAAACLCFLVAMAYFSVAPGWAIVSAHLAHRSLALDSIRAERCDFANRDILLAHISDLHITSIGGATRDGEQSGNKRLPGVLKQVRQLKAPWIVLSGDLTDAGEPAQWLSLESLLESTHTRMFVAPGNHDLNLFFSPEPAALDIKADDARVGSLQSLTRLARVAQFQARHASEAHDNTGTLLNEFLKTLPNKENIETAFSKEVSDCYERCRAATIGMEHGLQARSGCQIGCRYDWMDMRLQHLAKLETSFPWIARDSERGMVLISLHSIATKTDTVGQNAIGFIDDKQIEKLRSILSTLPAETKTIIVTLHHPLFMPESPAPEISVGDLLAPLQTVRRLYSSEWFMSIFLDNDAVQARKVYDLLRTTSERLRAAEVVVLYGHRHRRSLARMQNMLLVEAPNIGTSNTNDVGLYAISRDNSGKAAVHWCGLHS